MPRITSDEQAYEHECGEYTWWEYDAQGIELARVCEDCVKFKLSKYSHATLHGYSQADIDERIEPDY